MDKSCYILLKSYPYAYRSTKHRSKVRNASHFCIPLQSVISTTKRFPYSSCSIIQDNTLYRSIRSRTQEENSNENEDDVTNRKDRFPPTGPPSSSVEFQICKTPENESKERVKQRTHQTYLISRLQQTNQREREDTKQIVEKRNNLTNNKRKDPNASNNCNPNTPSN